MAEEKKETVQSDKANDDAALKPDTETLNTTDPQEHMEGPLSSLMQNIKEGAEENDEKDNADQSKE